MNRLADRSALLLSALGLAIVLLGGILLVQLAERDESWSDFWIASVVFFLMGFSSWVGVIRSRRRRLRRLWPLVIAWICVLSTHALVLGCIILTYRPQWRMMDWMLIGLIEWLAFGVLLEFAFRRSTR